MSTSNAETIFEREGALAWLTFNRPAQRNALTWAMYDGLVAACEAVDGDPGIRALLLRGAGGEAFAAGTDIAQFQGFTVDDARAYEMRIEQVCRRLEAVRCPTIALLEGITTGSGVIIALCCDLRLATPTLRFGIPVARTLGNCLTLANLARLVDAVGFERARDLMLTARLMGAEEALALGVVSEVVPGDQIAARGRALAERLAGHAPLTIEVTKEGLRRLRAHRGLAEEDELYLRCYASADFQEGVHAFLAKRPPRWTGR